MAIRYYTPRADAIIYAKPDDKSAKKGTIYKKSGGTVAINDPPKGNWGKLTHHDGWVWLKKFDMIDPDNIYAIQNAEERTNTWLKNKKKEPNQKSSWKPAPVTTGDAGTKTGYNLKGTPDDTTANDVNISPTFGKNDGTGFYGYQKAEDIDIPDTFGKDNFFNDYDMDLLELRENIKKIHENYNILSSTLNIEDIRTQMMTKFNRFRAAYPDTALTKTFGYVFFIRPDLNLYSGLGKLTGDLLPKVESEPTFHYANKNKPLLLKTLTSNFKGSHKFNALLSNRALSFEVQDEYIKSEEIGQTFTGYMMKYGKNNIESKTGGNLNIQFSEDNELSVYRHIKHWSDYISHVVRGQFSPKEEYIRNKVLDYATSIYYFLCGPDGESILFWSKYHGCFPTTQPSSNFSFSKGNFNTTPEFSVTFEYMSKEDFNPISIFEFNNDSAQDNYVYKRTYDANIVSTAKSMAGAPFIETYQRKNDYFFKLKFRPVTFGD
jgi:hypothetical protein